MKARTKVAILECDTPLPGISKQYGGGYGGVFKALLNSGARAEGFENAEEVLDISIYHVEDNPEDYPALSNIDALLLTGSRHDSFTNPPWIQKLVSYCAEALETKRVRVIGVCFGHQILARSMGVEVGRNPDGWEAAVNNVQLSPKGQEVFRLKELRIHQMHRDMVFSYPQGVEHLGSSPVCSVQGMYVPKRLITVQGHPEFTATIMREIIETRHQTGVFDEEAYQLHAKKIDLPHDGVIVGSAFVRFLLET